MPLSTKSDPVSDSDSTSRSGRENRNRAPRPPSPNHGPERPTHWRTVHCGGCCVGHCVWCRDVEPANQPPTGRAWTSPCTARRAHHRRIIVAVSQNRIRLRRNDPRAHIARRRWAQSQECLRWAGMRRLSHADSPQTVSGSSHNRDHPLVRAASIRRRFISPSLMKAAIRSEHDEFMPTTAMVVFGAIENPLCSERIPLLPQSVDLPPKILHLLFHIPRIQLSPLLLQLCHERRWVRLLRLLRRFTRTRCRRAWPSSNSTPISLVPRREQSTACEHEQQTGRTV